MTSTPPPASPPAAGGDEETGGGAPRRRWGPTRVVLTLVVVALVSMWGYVLYLAFGPGRHDPIDRLADTAFAEAGEARCARALDAVGELPLADESPNATARAGVIDKANGDFRAMLDDLDRLAARVPVAGDQRRRAEEWVSDWRLYVQDRQNYADKLRSDPDARMLVSPKPGQAVQVTEWIDEFANANRMPSCVTPGDV
jgi:hypothetical protein